MNSSEVLFRASGAGALLTDPRSKADKEAGVLSETAKTFVEKSWLLDVLQYEEPLDTPEMMKGSMCEEASTHLISKVIPASYRKLNRGDDKIRLKNDFFTGTYDIDLKPENIVEDVKAAWTPKTFFNAKISKIYYTQIQVYMDLMNYDQGRVIYALVDTPESIILDLENRLFYKYGCDTENPSYLESCRMIRHMHTPSRYIPEQDRVKAFEIKRNQPYIDELKRRIPKAREYYSNLKLNQIDVKEIEKFTLKTA